MRQCCDDKHCAERGDIYWVRLSEKHCIESLVLCESRAYIGDESMRSHQWHRGHSGTRVNIYLHVCTHENMFLELLTSSVRRALRYYCLFETMKVSLCCRSLWKEAIRGGLEWARLSTSRAHMNRQWIVQNVLKSISSRFYRILRALKHHTNERTVRTLSADNCHTNCFACHCSHRCLTNESSV